MLTPPPYRNSKFTLTEKLVPLLAKIKTKEPSVMIATLAVHEEMGKKCEIEAGAFLSFPFFPIFHAS